MKNRPITTKPRSSCALGLVSAALSIFAMLNGAAQAGLVAYWNFDEGSGTNVADSSSNGNDGTVVGTLTWVPGQTGGAGDFALSFPNNAANYVSVPDDTSLHINTPANQNFTLAAWVYNKGSVYGALYGQGTANPGGTRHMELQTQNGVSGDVPYIWSDTAGGPQKAFGADTAIDAWTHMAVTSDGTNLRTYLNGVLDTTSAAPAGISPADWGSVMLGRETRSANHALNGYLDDVVVFDSVEDVTQIMNGTHPAMAGGPDTTPPTISSLSPANGATAAAIGTNLLATFNEEIATGTGDITIKNLTDATQISFPVGDAQVSISGAVLTINPTTDLDAGDEYAIQIANGAIEDTSMNPFAGIADDTTWSFTTASDAGALFLIDLSDNSGSAAGWDVFSSDVTDAAVTDQLGGDNDVTLSITGILGTGNPAGAGATTVDGVTVPLEANNDYVWGDNQGNGGSILFEFKNLDAGSYNVSVFAGRTSDSNQEGSIWAGVVGDEPAKNTGDFANSSSTLSVSIGASDSLFYRHFPGSDWAGGTSGLIIKRTGSGGGNDFSDWIASPGFGIPPGEQGFEDDPDGDKLGNGIEAFFGTDPSVFSTGLTQVSVSGAVFSFEHPEADPPLDDVTGSYEWSLDLENWHPSGTVGDTTVTITPTGPASGTTTVTADTTGSIVTPTQLFIRAVATQ